MNLTRMFAIFLRQMYLVRGSIARVLPLFVWATVDITLWGFMTRFLSQIEPHAYNFVPAMLGAVLLWDFFIRVMNGVTMTFFEDVWSRNFLNIFATPLSIPEYLGGLVLSSIATSSVGLVVMLVLATTVFGLSFAVYGVLILPFLLVLFLFGIALGILGTAVVLRFGPAAEWFVWPIPAIVSPFVGVYYPVSTLPRWMQVVSRILPPSYVFESLRNITSGRDPHLENLAWAFGLVILEILIVCSVFTQTYRLAVRTGLIARYSAESV